MRRTAATALLLLGLVTTTSATRDLRRAAPVPEPRTPAAIARATEIAELYHDSNPYNRAPRAGVDPKFDCAWRRAAYAYGKTLQPRMTAAHLTQLSDALALGKCPGGAPAIEHNATTETERRTFTIQKGSTPVLVDPAQVDGLHAALERARKMPGHVTLSLMAGVHRITKPLLLSPADSNTAIQSHMGGDATLTGAKELPGLQWSKFKVASGAVSWKVEPNMNAVYGAMPKPGDPFWIHGTTASAPLCEAACKADARCNVWTWHDPSLQGYARQCWMRSDHSCCGTPEAKHTSGFKTTNASNIWMAKVPASAGVSKITGLRLASQRGQRARFPNANSELDQYVAPPTSARAC
jgi:hypothetical protein